jgi:hypothetical protein
LSFFENAKKLPTTARNRLDMLIFGLSDTIKEMKLYVYNTTF